jgi:NADP-dependent 3-hydroxy acid dehydrogenase YdfG
LDVLVNSVGVWLTGEAIDTPMGQWRKPSDILVNAAVNLTRTSVPSPVACHCQQLGAHTGQ